MLVTNLDNILLLFILHTGSVQLEEQPPFRS